jgi:hypothetical protein
MGMIYVRGFGEADLSAHHSSQCNLGRFDAFWPGAMITPASRVCDGLKAYARDKRLSLWRYNEHEGGRADDVVSLEFLGRRTGEHFEPELEG